MTELSAPPPLAAILCGGAGRRMGSLARGRPKALLPAFDKPLLWRQVEQLGVAGFEQIEVVTTPTLAPQIRDSLDRLDGSLTTKTRLRVRSCESQARGVLWGALAVLEAATTEKVLLCLGDIFFLSNPFLSIRSHLEADHDCLSAAPLMNEFEMDIGGLVLQHHGLVQSVVEQPSREILGKPLRWSGVFMVDRRSARTDLEVFLGSAQPDARPGDFLDYRCRQGVVSRVVDCPDFVNVNTPDELLLASLYARIESASDNNESTRALEGAAQAVRHAIGTRARLVTTPHP